MTENELENAANCALKFYEEYMGPGVKTKQYIILNILAKRTLKDLKNGKSAKECQYTVYDIYDEMTDITNKPSDDIRNKINRHLNNLEKSLPSHHAMLNELAIEYKLSHIPDYDFSAGRGGGAGNASTHSLIPLAVSHDHSEITDEVSIQGNMIKYYLEKIDDLPFWIKWLDHFELSGWRLNLLVIFMVTVFSVMLIFMIGFLFELGSINKLGLLITTTTGFIAIQYFLLKLVQPFYFSGTKRIILIPDIFLPIKYISGQFESIATDKIKESTGRNIRMYRMVSYSGKCPICGNRVELEYGGKEFYNRLIGRCLEAPEEHIFSFDRVKRIGYPLRDYYKDRYTADLSK